MNGEKDKLIRDFMNAFEKKDVKVLEEFFHPNVVFRNYGDREVRGREELLQVWSHVFGMFERVRFETVNQATNENIVIPHGRISFLFVGRFSKERPRALALCS